MVAVRAYPLPTLCTIAREKCVTVTKRGLNIYRMYDRPTLKPVGKENIQFWRWSFLTSWLRLVMTLTLFFTLFGKFGTVSWTDLPARARFSQLQRKIHPLMIWLVDIAQKHKSLRVTSEDDSCFAWWRDFVLSFCFIPWFPTLSSIRKESVDVDLTERVIHVSCHVINPASGCGRNWRNQGTFLSTTMSFHGKENK